MDAGKLAMSLNGKVNALSNYVLTENLSPSKLLALGFYDVKTAGAKGDGFTDDTTVIQSALNAYNKVYISDGTYLVDINNPISPKSNQTIIFSANAVFKMLPVTMSSYSIIQISNVHDVTIIGGTIIGDRATHLGTGGEWGNGINICNGSYNIKIDGTVSKNCWGDGFYLGGGTTLAQEVTNIELNNVIADNNRRQGLSITNADVVLVSNSIFKNTNGTAPQAGIDVEPNSLVGEITGITFVNVQCTGNTGNGLQFSGNVSNLITNVLCQNCKFDQNLSDGFFGTSFTGCKFVICEFSQNTLHGIEIVSKASDASFTSIVCDKNTRNGAYVRTIGVDNLISGLCFDNCAFSNNSQSTSSNEYGFLLYSNTGSIDNITWNYCNFYDDQSEHTQYGGITAMSLTGLTNLHLKNTCTYSGNIDSAHYLLTTEA
jgi:hypothetical protein